ncbi:hypothetical protein JL721_11152 [Aureococcus anophagefferens]|nr:hypothetical protein JL721_11152 [Aureococcus anophagefferens]
MAERAFAVLLLCAARCAGAGVDISFEVNDLSVAGDEFVVRLSIDRERLVVDDDVAALVRDGLRRVVAGRISDDHVATLVPAALAEARDVAAAQVAAEAPIRALLTPTAAVGAAFRWGDRADGLAAHVAFAVRAARRGLSALTAPDYRGALDIVGMSDAYGRHLLNNLLNAAGSRYLEIGTFKGSTLVAARWPATNFRSTALAVDSYAFGGDATFVGDIRQSGAEVRDEALANLETFLDPRAADRRELRVADCFSVDAATIGRFNVYPRPARKSSRATPPRRGPRHRRGAAIATRRRDRRPRRYLYDGDHEYDDQFRAFTHFDEALEDVVVALVDDWNHEPVRLGTRDAFARLGYDVVYGEVLGGGRTNGASINEHSVLKLPNPWWNGLYVAVVRKMKAHAESEADSL